MKNILILIIFTIFHSCSLYKKDSPPSQELGLLTGDLVLCSGTTFGDVKFAQTCDIDVRETFNLAISLLHSFEYPEAEKAFAKVMDIDPDCVMAYWGAAMSIYHEAWFPPKESDYKKGERILAAADKLPKNELESDYLNAIQTYYKNWKTVDHKTRAKAYETQMEALYTKYRNETEAAIFYALALYSTRDKMGKEYNNELKAGKILESLFPDQPNHPGIAHYIIHNYDNPELAHKALETARRYADIAPSSAHAQHMPSHIFTRLGLWDEAIESNINSMNSARCYSEETRETRITGPEVHAMDYLVYAYLQKGDKEGAHQIYNRLLESNLFKYADGPYNLAAIPARLYLENRDWQKIDLVELPDFGIPWKQHAWQRAMIYFAKGIGAYQLNDSDKLQHTIDDIRLAHTQLQKEEKTYSASQVHVQLLVLEGWQALMDGNHSTAIQKLEMAADMEDQIGKHPKTPGELIPARELLGDLYTEIGKYELATHAYQESLRTHPNRRNTLISLVSALRNLEKEKEADKFMNILKMNESTENGNNTL